MVAKYPVVQLQNKYISMTSLVLPVLMSSADALNVCYLPAKMACKGAYIVLGILDFAILRFRSFSVEDDYRTSGVLGGL